ncbi:MAG: hypothetical protein Q9217_004117 [Psora testacea]
MDTLTTHPSTAQQATAFTSPASLSFPGGMTPPSEKDGNHQANGNGQANGVNGAQQQKGADATNANGSGVTPTTPAATPAAGQSVTAGIIPTLQNIVATVNLDCRLDLKTIALHARNAEYNPKRFAAVIMRIREPKTTALIFASGKMVVTGAKSEDDSRLASRKYARIIQKLGFNAKFTDFKIQNIVGSCDIKFPIRLEGLASRHHHFSSYEPELFPGLIYRMIQPKIVLLIFVSGKIVLTGAKVREEIYRAFEMIYPVLNVSTFHALLLSPFYQTTTLTLLDHYLPILSPAQPIASHNSLLETQNPHAASIDSSRIIRADYANPAYTKLAREAQGKWRAGFGKSSNGRDVYWQSGIVVSAGREGNEYVQSAQRNCEELGYETESLQGGRAIRRGVGFGGIRGGEEEGGEESVGFSGYINGASGWADAGAAMAGLMEEVVRLARQRNRDMEAKGGVGKVSFKTAKARRLLFTESASANNHNRSRIVGVVLEDGAVLKAHLTILAAGAWTPSLIDLRGRAEASGQVLTYVPLTDAEAHDLRNLKILLNLSNGMFCIPPVKQVKGWELKVARHAYGYSNPTTVTPGPMPGQENIVASLPAAQFTPIPEEGKRACREFLGQLLPELKDRPFSRTRICWYADTPTGDFIVDYHPRYEGLLVATGDSGHAFKFLPVLGERVVMALEGRLEEKLKGLWKWREGKVGWWVTEDGSRGGPKGSVLKEEWAKGTIQAKMQTGDSPVTVERSKL